MERFDLAQLAATPGIDGELHLHESEYACTSLFIYPNRKGLKGIAPHYHSHCDDIELVLRGDIAIFGKRSSATVIPSNYMVINPVRSAHGYFVQAQQVIVLGVRAPKSYEGVPLLEVWRDEPGASASMPCARLVDLATATDAEYASPNAAVRIHRLAPAAECVLRPNDSEKILVALAPVDIDGGPWASHLPALGLAVLPGAATLRCRAAETSATIVEIRPRLARPPSAPLGKET
jgi:hypothetical protein